MIFDIETVPTIAALERPYPADERQPPTNYKNDEAIARWREADQQKWADDLPREAALSPRLGRVLTLAIGHQQDDGITLLTARTEKDEDALLRVFWAHVAREVQVAGFNSIGFDFHFLLVRSLILGVPTIIDVPRYLKRYSHDPHFDVRMALANWDSFGKGTLKDWCVAFGVEPPTTSGAEVWDRFQSEDFEWIEGHATEDLVATRGIVRLIGPSFGVNHA